MNGSILKIVKDELKIDFTKTFIERGGGNGQSFIFDIQPRDFLRFAKSDFKEKTDRGLINSLTNSKRAIDCQIDTAFINFGINYDTIPSSSNEIVNFREDINPNLPYKLKLISALDFAPSSLVSEVRELRNNLEHYYKKPNEEVVKKAIELAELFILAIESKMAIIPDGFIITDKLNFLDTKDYKDSRFSNYLYVSFYNKKIKLYKGIKGKSKSSLILNENNAEFYFFIQLFNHIEDIVDFNEAFKGFLKYLGHPIPEKHINVEF